MGPLDCVGYFMILVILSTSTVTSGFKDEPPSFNYDTLPSTSFSCKGRLPGRYYADAETDCQLFHVCVRMNGRDVQDFKFLCPNGTTFDQEHQVCMDYYQVVCHEGIGTNPLGSIYELLKLSSVKKSEGDLTSGKVSFVDPDVAERNTLGDDFQVDEYNNNRLASSQNSLGNSYKSSKSSSDIFYKNSFIKSSATSTYRPPTTSTTTRRPTTSTTTTPTPLLFRSPLPTRGVNSNTPSSTPSPRRPSLETFESYEIESVNAYGANRNSFNTYKNYDDSYEVRDSPSSSSYAPTATTSTSTSTTTSTVKPQVFHNTYRASPSTAVPTPQTFQQQPTRFNDDFFRKIPSGPTESSVPKTSKYAQFYVNSNTPLFYDDYSPKTKSTTLVYRTTTTTTVPPTPREPTTYKQSFDEFPRASFTSQDIIRTSDAPARQLFSAKTSSFQGDGSGSSRGLSNRGQFGVVGTGSKDSLRQSKFFTPPQSSSTSESDPYIHPQGPLAPKITHHSRPVEQNEEFLRPRSYSGTSNGKNNNNNVLVNDVRHFVSTASPPPPTTAEPPTDSTTFSSSGVTNPRGVTYFQRVTTSKPEKFSIFFSKSTPKYDDFRDSEKYSTSFYEDAQTSTTRRPTTTTQAAITEDYTAFEDSKTSVSASFDSYKVREFTDNAPKTTTTDYLVSEITSTTAEPTTTGPRSGRRGPRRRVNRPRTPPPSPNKEFDPEFKYSRRVVDATHLPKPQKVKNPFARQREAISSTAGTTTADEIFNAEASVYNGQPKANLFQEDRKDVTPSTVSSTNEGEQEGRNKLVENFGRKIRPGGLREQFVRAKQVFPERSQEVSTTQDYAAVTDTPTIAPRRLIKRLKVKTTAAPLSTTSTSTTLSPTATSTTSTTTTPPPTPAFSPFLGGSTLRPVKRINVKTKILGTRKLEKSLDLNAPFISTKTPFEKLHNKQTTAAFTHLSTSTSTTTTTTTTTPEPQLITASDEEVERKKSFLKLSTPFGLKETTTPTTYRPPIDAYLSKNLSTSTSSVITSVPKKSEKAETFPISFKEPILSGRQETRVEVKESRREETSSATRSPDYDYAYYNTDNDDDYATDAASRLIDPKNYGKKPKKTSI